MSKFITTDPPYNAGLYPTTAGFLELANGVALSSTLTEVTDQLNTASTLYLSTDQVKIGTIANDTPLALFGYKNISAIFNTIQLSSTDKTFTFPDASMTFAGINISQTFTGLNNFTTTQNFNVPNDTSGTSNISIPTRPHTNGGRNANHPTLVLGSVTGSIWGNTGFGTYLGINAPTGWAGNLIDLKFNDTTVLNITQTGAVTSTASGAASTPALSLTGTWFKSGSTTTTKPQFLIEPTSTSSTNWSILGTGLGINAASDFSGNLLDLQKNGTSVFNVSSTGAVTSSSSMTLGSSSLSAIRLYVKSDGANSVFRVDNSSNQRLFEVDNNNRLILGNSGLLFAYGNGNFALTSQLSTGYSYIFGNGSTKTSASAVIGTFQLNESISNPSGATSSYRGVELNYSINNSAGAVTGTATGIFVNGTETGSGLNGMTHNLMDLQKGGVSQFRVDRVGAFSCGNTVAAAIGIASTHKVTVVIGGVTYYLLASNV